MNQNNQMESQSSPAQNITGNEKREKKQKIIRNEFEGAGKYGIPLIKKQKIDLEKTELWGYVKTKPDDWQNKLKTIHFFTYDWLFENVYVKPEDAIEKLEQYYAILSPDFSTYTDMPLALQIYSTFRNRWCGAFWQKHGMRVIPTISWGMPESYEFCFDGVEQNSVVAVSTYHMENDKQNFMPGYNKMLEVLNPSAIICYGDKFDEMKGNIKVVSPFNYEELIAKMGLVEYLKKLKDGSLYPSN